MFDNPYWNNIWKKEWGLAKRQFSRDELMMLNLFHPWAVKSAATYMLNNGLKSGFNMGALHSIGHLLNIEELVGGVGMARFGRQAMKSF